MMKKILYTSIVFFIMLSSLSINALKVSAADPISVEGWSVDPLGDIAPKSAICFHVTVKVNEGQLLESRGDMLRNVENPYGHWPHIAVKGTVDTGSTYTFSCYGGMIAPDEEGTYQTKWQVWRDGNWAGPVITISFVVHKGGNTITPTIPDIYQSSAPCRATDVESGVHSVNGHPEHFIVFTIPNGNPITDQVFTQQPGLDSYSRQLKAEPVAEWTIQSPGPDQATNMPHLDDRQWRVLVPGRVVDEWWPLIFPGSSWGRYANMFLNNPEDMIYLRCKIQVTPTSYDQYLPVLQDLAIASPKSGTQLTYQVDIPDWMSWIQTTVRKGSNATIKLIAPDGAEYSSTNSAVNYQDTPTYAVHSLNLDSPKGGTWKVVVDVISAEENSVFMLDVYGKQIYEQSKDNIPPVTGMHFDGTRGMNGWFVSDVTVTLSAEDNAQGSGLQGTEWSLDNGATWQPYTGPFTVSQEGLSYILGRSYDKEGNYEQSPIGKYLMIDKTPPVVTVTSDQAEYTRVQPYTVHFSAYDPMPGSDMASLSAVFNGQPMIDGQVIDLFWYHLGEYTLSASGQDNAGWTSTSKVSWRLIATIDSMKASLTRFCDEGYITNAGTCNSLQQKLDAAKAARERGQYKTAINILGAFNSEVTAQDSKKISSNVAVLLHEDANFVIEGLKMLR